ncbi:MAG TPA: hypothetical protein PLU88_04765 [Armatimonadota bacterium]|jgi:hypothetical protein|nr:hypothetical protein [Armatimonadota bacterium]
MRRMVWLWLAFCTSPVVAHSEEILGHHWASRQYWSEMLLQQILILVAVTTAVVIDVVLRLRRARRCG